MSEIKCSNIYGKYKHRKYLHINTLIFAQIFVMLVAKIFVIRDVLRKKIT